MSNSPEHWPRAVEGIIGSTLDAIGRPALRDIYNAVLGDRITAWRSTNLADVFRKYQEATKDLPAEGKRFVAEKVGICFLEEASLEDEPELQKIWANLLAAAVSKQRPEVTPRYISVAKQLTPDEAFFLKAVYEHTKKPAASFGIASRVPLKEALPSRNPDQVDDILEHLTWLGLVLEIKRTSPGSLLSRPDPNNIVYAIALSKFGWQFVCAAIEGAG